MEPPQTRQQRRAAERKARKLARKATQPLAASPAPAPAQGATEAGAPGRPPKRRFSPELEDEFSPELLSRASSIYEHFERKAAARRTASTAAPKPQQPTSPVRAEINRANAQHSTGPRTSAGKMASSRNSLKHGLAAPQLIIPGEDRTAFDALLADLLDEHQPANISEELLVHQIAQSWWLTQRALRFQNECFTAEGVDQKRLSLFLRYQTTHERAFHKALSALTRLKKDRAHGFVSQPATKARLEPGFVSQDEGEPSRLHQSVSRNCLSENQFKENAA